MTPRSLDRGFTLLEVMVAVAILGLGLTAILSAQAGAFSTAAHARNISMGTGLLRCKMSEVEEHLLRDGFQELAEEDSGPCCEGDETPNMKCTWRIEKPELPEPKYGELDLDSELSLSTGSGGPAGALGALTKSENGENPFSGASGVGDIAQQLTSGGEGDPLGGGMAAAAGIAGMVMSMIYPDLKTIFEASTRKATVTLTWTEGDQEYSMELVQWITSPQEGNLVGDIPGQEDE